MVEASDNIPCYSGATLFACHDNLRPPNEPEDKLFRLPLQEVYKIGGIGTVPTSRSEIDTFAPNLVITLEPMNTTNDVKSVEMHLE